MPKTIEIQSGLGWTLPFCTDAVEKQWLAGCIFFSTILGSVETVSDFIFWGSKITADGDCAMKLKDAYSLEGKL